MTNNKLDIITDLYKRRGELNNSELNELLNLEVQYLQGVNLGEINIPFSEEDTNDLLEGYVFNWNFKGIDFILFNSEYYISGTDEERLNEINAVTRKAVETMAFETEQIQLTDNELLEIIEGYANVILFNEKPKTIYIDFSEEDLYELRDGGSFDWTFSGYDIHSYDENSGDDNDDEDDYDEEDDE